MSTRASHSPQSKPDRSLPLAATGHTPIRKSGDGSEEKRSGLETDHQSLGIRGIVDHTDAASFRGGEDHLLPDVAFERKRDNSAPLSPVADHDCGASDLELARDVPHRDQPVEPAASGMTWADRMGHSPPVGRMRCG